MKLDDIHTLWESDCTINTLNLTEETVRIAKLHAKYSRIYVAEKIVLRKYQADYKVLKLEKEEFLINPTEEKIKSGWKIPAQGRLLKNEVSRYLEGDSDLVSSELKIGVQHEKVDLLKSILDQIHVRGYQIKNILEDRRFMNGG